MTTDITNKLKRKKRLSTGSVIILGFIVLILVGSLLLFLPFANTFEKHGPAEYFDCLFTSASSICVTGLSTLSVHDSFTLFGQAVMLLLIQIGGLGFMTAAILISRVIKRRITPKEQMIAAQSLGFESGENVRKLMYAILRRTLVIETVGTLLLCVRMWKYSSGFFDTVWNSVFHSVSAFCNAGFDLFSFEKGSLTGMSGDPYLLSVIMALIMIGGIGFVVWDDVLSRLKDKTNRLSVYTKFVFSVSAVLLFSAFISTLLLEYDNDATIGGMSFIDKIFNSAFHSVTLRTAGFATVPSASLRSTTKLISCLMMFIGGCSGSTAGGVKVGTIGLIVFAVARFSFGKKNLNIGGRAIDYGVVMRAFSLFFVGMLIIFAFTGIFSAIEQKPVIDLLFETASAFGTVGLSSAETPTLSIPVKCMLILLMYFGRVGILTVTTSFTAKSSENDHGVRYPNAVFYVG